MICNSNEHNLRLLYNNYLNDISCNDKFELMLVDDIHKFEFSKCFESYVGHFIFEALLRIKISINKDSFIISLDIARSVLSLFKIEIN